MEKKKRGFNKKKIITIVIIGVILVIAILLVWFLYLYPHKVFRENEELLDAAGKRYFQINRTRLPSEEGRVVSVPLSTLTKQDYVDGLYEAYGNKLCDLNESNVKVVLNSSGDYEYYTYLKCGNYESDVDHDGPVITLNGDTTIRLSRGDTYEELGVKSVKDNVDGEMNVSLVRIKGEVDTSRVGTYEVTYTISDWLSNESSVTRTVIVEESLSDVVKSATRETNNYYRGMAENNYVMFNNMVFRIVKVNDDDTVTIVSNELLSNVDYTNSGRFEDSSLDKWLNDYFYNLLEKKYKDLIVSSSWCDDVISTNNYMTTECSRTSAKRNVGILSIQDYNNTTEGSGFTARSFLDNSGLTWYANLDENNNPWYISSLYDYPSKSQPMNQEYLFNVRPAVTLKKNTTILDGDGSSSDPYILVENNSARRNTLVNTRQVGEYISYSGYTWRIVGTTDDNTTEIIMTGVVTNNSEELQIGYQNSGAKVYNPNKEGNIGYQVINNMTRYVSTDLFARTKIEVPIYEKRVTYEGKHDTKTYNNIVTIPSTFDIFTAKGDNSSSGGYWLIDSSKAENTKTRMFAAGTIDYDNVEDETMEGVKLKAYLKDDVFITDGDGTLSDPYTIRD